MMRVAGSAPAADQRGQVVLVGDDALDRFNDGIAALALGVTVSSCSARLALAALQMVSAMSGRRLLNWRWPSRGYRRCLAWRSW